MSEFELPDNDILDVLFGEEADPEWLIRDFLIQGSFTTLIGESGAGKSTIAYLLALAVASGQPVLSGLVRPAEPRRVLYFDDENSGPDGNRYLRTAFQGMVGGSTTLERTMAKLLDENLRVVRGKLRRAGEHWAEAVADWVIAYRPHLIVYDTANACTNVEEENSNAEAGRTINKLKDIATINESDGFVACSLPLKHAKTRAEKGQIRTVRGAKVWKDMSDQTVFQIKLMGRPRKDNLSGTRLVPDKTRAYGLRNPIYIDPMWTDAARTALVLRGSLKATQEHNKDESEG